MTIDETGTVIPDSARWFRQGEPPMCAEALQIALKAMMFQAIHPTTSTEACRDIASAMKTVADILQQRGCGDMTTEPNGYLTHLMDIVIFG